MIRLSVNVNKVATLRNSRGGAVPRVLDAVRVCVDAGAQGITVHPRADGGTSRPTTSTTSPRALAPLSRRRRVQHRRGSAARSDRARAGGAARPVHARAGRARRDHESGRMDCRHRRRTAGRRPRPEGGRHPRQPVRRSGRRSRSGWPRRSAPTAWSCTPSRSRGPSSAAPRRRGEVVRAITRAAARARARAGLGVNAGHDLDLENLTLFRSLPHLDEVSIGHAIMSRAVFVGLDRVVREYLGVLAERVRGSWRVPLERAILRLE